MRGVVRCIEGRSWRHDPQWDDPYLKTDIGQCPECGGEGCEDRDSAERQRNTGAPTPDKGIAGTQNPGEVS